MLVPLDQSASLATLKGWKYRGKKIERGKKEKGQRWGTYVPRDHVSGPRDSVVSFPSKLEQGLRQVTFS